MVLFLGDLCSLEPTLFKQWQEKVLKHIVHRRLAHQNDILAKTTQIMADLQETLPQHARWIKWYSIDTASKNRRARIQ